MDNIHICFAFYLIDRILKNKQYSRSLVKKIYICDVNKRSFFAIKNLVELCPGNEDFLREFLSDRTIILWLNCYNRLILVLIVTIILQ